MNCIMVSASLQGVHVQVAEATDGTVCIAAMLVRAKKLTKGLVYFRFFSLDQNLKKRQPYFFASLSYIGGQ